MDLVELGEVVGKSVVLKASMGTVANDDDAVGLFLRVNEFQKSGRKRRLRKRRNSSA